MTGAAAEPLRDTPLKERHVALGARMIPFAGWVMPVQYAGIVQEHHAVRNAAGLFDLESHGAGRRSRGRTRCRIFSAVTTNDVSVLEPGAAQYSLLPNEQGGLIDDIIVYRRPGGDGYFVVINASNQDARRRLDASAGGGTDRSRRDGRRRVGPDRDDRDPGAAGRGDRAAADAARPAVAARVSYRRRARSPAFRRSSRRTGYTGEDGFEFYTPIERIGDLWDALMRQGADEGLVAGRARRARHAALGSADAAVRQRIERRHQPARSGAWLGGQARQRAVRRLASRCRR